MSVSVCQGTKEASPLITVRLNGHFRCEASNIIDVVDAVLRLIETKTQRNTYVCVYVTYVNITLLII